MSIWTDFIGSELRQVEVAGISTRVLSAGSGEDVVVLLHGRGGHLESWRGNVAALAEHGRVIAFDLLGHGLTGRHSGGYGVQDLADHALETLNALGVPKATLVGQSIGGWVATLIALDCPERVSSLVLVEPAGLQTEEERLAEAGAVAAYKRGGRAFSEPTSEAVRERLLGLVADPAMIDDELVETRRALYAPAAAREVHKAVRAADNGRVVLTPETLRKLSVPVLFVHGGLAHTPGDVVERAVEAARGRLVTVADARQWPQLERPEIVNELIVEFGGNE